MIRWLADTLTLGLVLVCAAWFAVDFVRARREAWHRRRRYLLALGRVVDATRASNRRVEWRGPLP